MNRHNARETAFRMIFQMDVGKNEYEMAKETMKEAIVDSQISLEDCPYIEAVVQGVNEKREELDKFIAVHSRGWKLERINPVDRNLIRLALYEVRYVDDVPFEVALDEAVELAKAYGEDESYAFVNGILDNAKKFAEDASTEDKEDNAVREEAKES